MNERSKRTIKLKDRDTVATIDIYFNQDNTFELHVSFPIPPPPIMIEDSFLAYLNFKF